MEKTDDHTPWNCPGRAARNAGRPPGPAKPTMTTRIVSSVANLMERIEMAARRIDPEVEAALQRRWNELPSRVRTPAQLLGRRSAGCEGTHGVFPQCNFGCRPCYHSADANRVRIDGPHTLTAVDAQMAFARQQRGPGQFAQLIGGEVSLLNPDDHAEALLAMRRHGRIPMSFSHGDFDYDYLESLALGPDGQPRFKQIAFAIHIDSTMTGRRSVPRPSSETELDDERHRVAEMFHRLKREHGISHYLAHNMTVTPQNLESVPMVIANNRDVGYRMFSFQPAAYVGHERRWAEGFGTIGGDDVWARIEQGAGTRLPYRGLQFGDLRCSRSSWGAFVQDRYVPVIDDNDTNDLAARDEFFRTFPGPLGQGSAAAKGLKVALSIAMRPQIVPTLGRWAKRFVVRSGGVRSLRWLWSARRVTFVMHRFMDASDVAAAWGHMQSGTVDDIDHPVVVETAERLAACAYSMAHPETGEMVPACVQHSVLDPEQNRELVELLPRKAAAT